MVQKRGKKTQSKKSSTTSKKTVKKTVNRSPKTTKKVVKKATRKIVKKPAKTTKKVQTKKAVTKPSAKKKSAAKVNAQVDNTEFLDFQNEDDILPPPTFDEIKQELASHNLEVPKPAYTSTKNNDFMDDSFPQTQFNTETDDDSFEDTQELARKFDSLQQTSNKKEEREKKPTKKSFFKRLFGKKDSLKTESQIPPLDDIAHKTQSEIEEQNFSRKLQNTNPIEEETPIDPTTEVKNQDEQTVTNSDESRNDVDDAHKRQEEYVANLRRRLDSEIRERQEHLDALQSQLSNRESELDQKHEVLRTKEEELVELEEKYSELQKREHELDDLKLTLDQKETELEKLQQELADKESDLSQKEDELAQKEEALALQEEQIQSAKPKSIEQNEDVFEEDTQRLTNTYQFKPQQEPKAVKAVESPKSVQSPTKQILLEQLQEAYTSLHHMNITKAKKIYVQLTTQYKDFVAEYGQDSEMYQDILDLYKDIKLAMVHAS